MPLYNVDSIEPQDWGWFFMIFLWIYWDINQL